MYIIRKRETFEVIDSFYCCSNAIKQLRLFEKFDKENGCYKKDSYEIYDDELGKVIFY